MVRRGRIQRTKDKDQFPLAAVPHNVVTKTWHGEDMRFSSSVKQPTGRIMSWADSAALSWGRMPRATNANQLPQSERMVA